MPSKSKVRALFIKTSVWRSTACNWFCCWSDHVKWSLNNLTLLSEIKIDYFNDNSLSFCCCRWERRLIREWRLIQIADTWIGCGDWHYHSEIDFQARFHLFAFSYCFVALIWSPYGQTCVFHLHTSVIFSLWGRTFWLLHTKFQTDKTIQK